MGLEPRFDRFAEQERGRSRRIKLILALMLGPSIILGSLGYYDAAATTFVFSFFAGFLVIVAVNKLNALDPLLETTGPTRFLILALLFLYLGYRLSKAWRELENLF